jgi:nitrite reductase/ring-hydroxylating ferredoxin subunit
MTPPSRRQFVAACACVTCPALRALGELAAERAGPVDVGPLEDFKAKGIFDPAGAGRTFYLVNRAGRLYAVSSTCTHRRVGLVVKDGAFRCPRHGSAFSVEGEVTKAPARKPLQRFAIHVNDEGRVVVDPSHVFGRDGWKDPRSFIPLD